jgi:hypothetical protein
MDSLDNQSFVLRTELADSQHHLPSSDAVGNNHHAPSNDPSLMEHRSADPSFEVSEVAHQRGGTYPLTASPGRDHRISGNELTGGDTTNNDDI